MTRRTRLTKEPTMKTNTFSTQWGGAAFMLGSLLFLVNKLNEMSRLFLGHWIDDLISGQNGLLILIGQVAYIIGYITFWQLYAPRVGQQGKNALRCLCGGGSLVAVSHLGFASAVGEALPLSWRAYGEYFFFLLIIGLMLLIIGLIWFGILNLRHSVLVGRQWLPLATGVMGFIGFFLFSGEQITATFLFFRTLFALGLLGLGLTIWLEKPVPLQLAR